MGSNTQPRGNRVLSGTHADVWIDGERIFECKKFEVKVSVNREDVQMGIDVDSKMTGQKAEINMTVSKVYSRFEKYRLAFNQGKDLRSQITARLQDPDAVGGQMERYSLENVWLNELPVFSGEKGALIEQEISGGCTPSDIQNLDQIKPL